jgi:hypothetical protein
MAELSIETATYCASNEFFETSVDGHKIRFERSYSGNYPYDWTCTCKGSKPCKHIALVKEEGLRCGWNGEMDPTLKVAPDGTCPDCGGPVRATRVGV